MHSFRAACLRVLMTSGYGCGPIGCSSYMTKTDVLWCSSSRRQHQTQDESLRVGSDLVQPVRSVRNLGIHLDSDLSMNTHITRTVSCCFAVLWQIGLRSISRSVRQPVVQLLIVSLVISRLDYGSATLASLTAFSYNRLQSVLNAAAHLDLQIQEISPRDAADARPSLVANTGTNHV